MWFIKLLSSLTLTVVSRGTDLASRILCSCTCVAVGCSLLEPFITRQMVQML